MDLYGRKLNWLDNFKCSRNKVFVKIHLEVSKIKLANRRTWEETDFTEFYGLCSKKIQSCNTENSLHDVYTNPHVCYHIA